MGPARFNHCLRRLPKEFAAIRSESVYRFSIGANTVESLRDGHLEPLTICWTSDGSLVFAARLEKANRKTPSRTDWWVVEGGGEIRNLTSAIGAVPTLLYADTRGSLIGTAGGDLWRIHTDEEPENLTGGFKPEIGSIVWPRGGNVGAQPLKEIITTVATSDGRDFFRFELDAGTIARLEKPVAEAILVDFSSETGIAVFTAATRSGTFLWLSKDENHRSIVETNQHLRGIVEAAVQQIEYESLQGEPLTGWVALPVGYEEGRAYPLIAFVYPGLVYGDQPPSHLTLNSARSLYNMQLLASRGYAVLFPSMPLGPDGVAGDPYMALPDAVLPAIDKVIEMGIADSERLGVMGQSFGGFGTYGLITQTNRFKAAVALAGFGDLVSLYGSFDARFRYGDHPHERRFPMWLFEIGQLRMGGPPWKDRERYLRNSPQTFIDQIETPLMIVQGDMDYVSMEQGEQIFTALFRQNKRAQFVRYWGEGHVIQSPANIRDLWERISAWFDKFLK